MLAHYDEILAHLAEGKNVDVAYLDFAKAFDKVDFGVLLNKLSRIGIRGKTLAWIKSFLQGRTFMVVVNGATSTPYLVISGVPQGSVLGPLLFIILLRDIDKDIVVSSVRSFADDTRISKSISNPSDIKLFQGDLQQIYHWAERYNLTFNDTKFELVQYGNDKDLKELGRYESNSQSPIKSCDSVRDLGITMSNDASFKDHLDDIVTSANKLVGWICRTFMSRSSLDMLSLWKSLVLLKMEYCS